jgi:hypothetical protein
METYWTSQTDGHRPNGPWGKNPKNNVFGKCLKKFAGSA